MNSDNYRVTTGHAVDAARLTQDNQSVRTLSMHETNTVHVVQYLFEQGVQGMSEGNQSLTRRVVEITADAIEYIFCFTPKGHGVLGFV